MAGGGCMFSKEAPEKLTFLVKSKEKNYD